MNIINRVYSNANLTENDKQILTYIISNPFNILEMSIRSLAEKAYVSPSAIVRFYRKLGFKSYKSFIFSLSKELDSNTNNTELIDANFPFSRIDSDEIISLKIAKLSSEVIYETQAQLNIPSLTKATELFFNGTSIYGIGVSHSFNRVVDFQTKMLRIRKYVKTMPLQSDQFHLTDEAREGDVVLAISYGGETAEIINDVIEFKKKGVNVIAVTSNLNGELSTVADVILSLPKRENPEENISTFVSQIAIELVLNTLFSCIYKRNYAENISSIRLAPTSSLK